MSTLTYTETRNQGGFITSYFADDNGTNYAINLPTVQAVADGEIEFGGDHIRSVQSLNKYSNQISGRVILTSETLNLLVDSAVAYCKAQPELYAAWAEQVKA